MNTHPPSKSPPVEVLRDGALKATIWENEGENGTYFTTTFARTYQADADKVGRRVRFIIHSYPLIGKNREANRIVEQQRAILVRERLTALGLDGGLIGIHPEEDLTKAGSGVTVMPELVPAP